jgi:hypothetical protein
MTSRPRCLSPVSQLTTQNHVTTDGQSASPSRCQLQIFVTVRQLLFCWCEAPSLTKGRVCRLQLLLDLASAVIFRSESRGTYDNILQSWIWDSPNLEVQVPIFIFLRSTVAKLYPQAFVSFFCLLRLAGLRWRYSNPSSQAETNYSVRVRVTSRLAVYGQTVRLGSKPLRITTRVLFLRLTACGHILYVTSSQTRGWVCLLWICLDFVKSRYRTYNILLEILPCALYTSPVSVEDLQSRLCIHVSYLSYVKTAA